MTLEDAELAGQLAEALRDFIEVRRCVTKRFNSEPNDLLGIGFSHEYSDAGSSGIGPDIKLPPHLIVATLDWLQERLTLELRECGVELTEEDWASG